MPMSEGVYEPSPDMPSKCWYKAKEVFTLEKALIGALHEETKVRAGHRDLDIVCWRLRTYLPTDDPILVANELQLHKVETTRRSAGSSGHCSAGS